MNKRETAKNYLKEMGLKITDEEIERIEEDLYTKDEMIKYIKTDFSSNFKTSCIDMIELYWYYFDLDKFFKMNIAKIGEYYCFKDEAY